MNRYRSDVSYFAQTNHRTDRRLFGIKQADRLSHMYVIGKTGVGKSTLLEALIHEDLKAHRGFALIDPHGDLAARVYADASPYHKKRIRYLNAPDRSQPYGYNPLRRVRDDKIPLAASGIIETFKKLWPDAWGMRMEHILRNCLYALLERDDAILPDILRLFADDVFRKRIARGIRNDTVRRFWQYEFENYHIRMRSDGVAPIQNKLGALLSDPTLYRILVRPEKPLRFRSIMDCGGVVLVNISKGQLGEDSALVLGGLIASTIGLAAFSRAETAKRSPFFLYMDEFQNFTTLMIANMMSELRKFGVGLILAHQYLHQLEPEIRHAIIGNAATLISFRVGADDAPMLVKEFQPIVDLADVLNLPNRAVYLKLMIDGSPSKPFSANLCDGMAQATPA